MGQSIIKGERMEKDPALNEKEKLLTPKQEAFCLAYMELKNSRHAYIKAYPGSEKWKPDSVDRKAFDMLLNVKIKARIEELKAEIAKTTMITVQDLINELEEARKLAHNEGQSGAAVSAVMGKAKLLGYDIQKTENKTENVITIHGGLPDGLFRPEGSE